MKTLFTEQEFHDTEDKKESNHDASLTRSFKIAEKKITQNLSAVNNSCECNNSSESDNLIICNAEQPDSFQTSKPDKLKLSPGIYLQKVLFNSVTQKFRSQSLPNCLEKKKYKSVFSDKIEDVQEISVPLVNDADIKEVSSDGWFKTWPERTVDKVIVRSGNEVIEEQLIGNSDRFTEEKDHSNSQGIKTTNSISQCNSRKNINIVKEPSSWKNHKVSNTQSTGVKDDDSKFHNCAAKASCIPLDKLLDSFPLAYSPVTKQLLLIPTSKGKPSNSCNSNTSEKCDICEPGTCRNSGEAISNLEESTLGKSCGGKGLLYNPKGLECDGPGLQSASTEVSSFSSTVSSLSDHSPSTNEDSALGSLLDHGDTCSLVSLGSCSAFSEDSVGEKSRKKSLTGFFSRSVFNWKGSSRSEECHNGSGWRIFSKNSSPGSSHTSLSTDHYAESDGGSVAPDSPSSVRSGSSLSNKTTGSGLEKRVASSSALIQLARPAHLPAKTQEEEARHRQEYQQMVEAARKRELKEAKQRKKQMQAQLRVEEQLAHASRVWTHEILPRWDQMHNCKKAKELWWQGVPPCVRGKVWQLAIGNPLHLTHSLYDIYVQKAQDRLRSEKDDCCGSCGADGDCVADSRERSMQQIQLDISRTFPHLCIFQKGGPYYDTLHCLLAAYVCYRPDVGYVQGMSFIAAVLILNMEAADAFVCFANLLNSPCHMAFFHLNQPLMQAYYSTYNDLFKYNLPQLFAHFNTTALSPDLYLLDWIYTVFSKAMCLDLACRVWDVFLRDGEPFIFRTALGILHLYQDALLQMDFVHGSQFLTKLPDDLSGDQLFRSISCIKMTVGKATFDDILSVNSVDCH